MPGQRAWLQSGAHAPGRTRSSPAKAWQKGRPRRAALRVVLDHRGAAGGHLRLIVCEPLHRLRCRTGRSLAGWIHVNSSHRRPAVARPVTINSPGTPRSEHQHYAGKAVAASPATCTSTRCLSPSTGVVCSPRRCLADANTPWRRYVRTLTQPWPSSTERKIMSTCSGNTLRRWRFPTWPTPSEASHPRDCVRTSSAESTGQGRVEDSRHRHTSPGLVVAHHFASSRTTSQTRNNQTRQSFHPALKDRVSALDHR
jgi:hypothetical protein